MKRCIIIALCLVLPLTSHAGRLKEATDAALRDQANVMRAFGEEPTVTTLNDAVIAAQAPRQTQPTPIALPPEPQFPLQAAYARAMQDAWMVEQALTNPTYPVTASEWEKQQWYAYQWHLYQQEMYRQQRLADIYYATLYPPTQFPVYTEPPKLDPTPIPTLKPKPTATPQPAQKTETLPAPTPIPTSTVDAEQIKAELLAKLKAEQIEAEHQAQTQQAQERQAYEQHLVELAAQTQQARRSALRWMGFSIVYGLATAGLFLYLFKKQQRKEETSWKPKPK